MDTHKRHVELVGHRNLEVYELFDSLESRGRPELMQGLSRGMVTITW